MHEFQDFRWQSNDTGPTDQHPVSPGQWFIGLLSLLFVPGYKMLWILRDLFNPVFSINSIILNPQFFRRQGFQEHTYGITAKVLVQKYFIQIKNLLITSFYNHSSLLSNLSSSEKAS